MSPEVELLDAVALVRGYLLEHPKVEALVGERVGQKSPREKDRDEPWVRITQLDATNETGTTKVEHLVSYYLQLDCYAGVDNWFSEAWDLNTAVRAALVAMPDAEFEEAVVTMVGIASNPAPPDTDLEPARERSILEAEILAHPR